MSFAARRMGGIPSSTLVINDITSNLIITPSQITNYTVGMRIEIVVPVGIWVYSTDTANAALSIIAFNPSDSVTITNFGYIVGKGGTGGSAYGSVFTRNTNAQGKSGGRAIDTFNAISINNISGYIGGGGGGGGAGISDSSSVYCAATGGGGAGGGIPGYVSMSSYYIPESTLVDPESGTPNGSTFVSSAEYVAISTGGYGGYRMPGSSYTGAGSLFSYSPTSAVPGYGASLYSGSSGSGATSRLIPASGVSFYTGGGGGGGWGSSGGDGIRFNNSGTYASGGAGAFAISAGLSANSDSGGQYLAVGGAGGKAVELNAGAGSITWVGGAASSSRAYGAVS